MNCCLNHCSTCCKSAWESSVEPQQRGINTPSVLPPEAPIAVRDVWTAAAPASAAGGAFLPQPPSSTQTVEGQPLTMFGVRPLSASTATGLPPLGTSSVKEAQEKGMVSKWEILSDVWKLAPASTSTETLGSSSAASSEQQIPRLPVGKVLRRLDDWLWIPLSNGAATSASEPAQNQAQVDKPSASRGRMKTSHKPPATASSVAVPETDAGGEFQVKTASENKLKSTSASITASASAAMTTVAIGATPLTAAASSNINFSRPIPIKINQHNLNNWITAHNQKIQGSARTLVRATTYVPHAVFLAAFQQTIKDFEKSRKNDSNFQYVSIIKPEKSLIWMNDMAKGLLEKKPDNEVIIDQYRAFLDGLIKAHSSNSDVLTKFPKNIVIFEDGIYSGKQITDFIKHMNSETDKLINQSQMVKLPKPNFIIVCPFITQKGKERIHKLAAELSIVATIVGHRQIETLNQALARLEVPPNIKSKLKQMRGESINVEKDIFDTKKNWDDISMCFFDHKIPDYLSFPINLSKGVVMQMDGNVDERGNIQFLPDVEGPYHKDFDAYCKEMN